MSNTLWALATLRFQPHADWLAALCDTAASPSRLRAFGPQALANTAQALARLEYLPSPSWCRAFLLCCRDTLWLPEGAGQPPQLGGGAVRQGAGGVVRSWVEPQSLALVAWAVARLGLAPGRAWVEELAAAAAGQAAAGRLMPLDVANMMWALSVLAGADGVPHTGQHSGDVQGQAPGQAGGDVDNAALQGLGASLGALLHAWQRAADAMEPQQLSACLVATARLRRSGAVTAATAQAAVAAGLRAVAAPRVLEAASGQCMANALWAVASMGVRPPQEWVAAVVARFVECAVVEDDVGPQVGGCRGALAACCRSVILHAWASGL